jgi:sortase A
MKKLATAIIIIGILVMICPIVGKLYMQWQENKLLEEWYNSEDATSAEVSATSDTNAEEAFKQLQDAFSSEAGNNANEGTSSSITESPAGNTKTNTTGTGIAAKPSVKTQTVLGIIKIDKIKIKYPIVEGVKLSNISRAIGHVSGTAGLGQPGNCALAGHRNYTFGRYFNRLDEVKVGDIISITTKKAEFQYKVYEKLVVMPDDVSVLKGSKDDTVLTLITCTPIYVATHRLILHARLDKKILLEP